MTQIRIVFVVRHRLAFKTHPVADVEARIYTHEGEKLHPALGQDEILCDVPTTPYWGILSPDSTYRFMRFSRSGRCWEDVNVLVEQEWNSFTDTVKRMVSDWKVAATIPGHRVLSESIPVGIQGGKYEGNT